MLLTVDTGEICQRPNGPVLALWGVSDSDQPDDGVETSVVDVPRALEVPALDGVDHSAQHLRSRRIFYRPRLGTVADDVSQNSCRIVADL